MDTGRAGIATILLFASTACGGGDDASSQKQSDFDHGTPVQAQGGNGGGTSEAPFQKADYPAGPYGNQVGQVIPNLYWLGWKKPVEKGYDPEAFEKISLSDYYNPNGDKPVKVLWINSSAVWCGPCKQEYAYLNTSGDYLGKLAPMGVEILGTLMEDAKNPPGPAKPTDLKYWGETYEVPFPLLLDPSFKLGMFFTSDAIPMGMVVNTRTMVIESKLIGGGSAGVQKVQQEIEKVLANW